MQSRPKKRLSTDELGVLFFIAALIFGAWFRLFPSYSAGFPINDGGLFYKMIEALQGNNYRLPEYVQYNGLNIPFAYPPLAFYIGGLISDVFNITLINIFLWLPAVTLIMIIPAVYWLANIILQSRFQAGLAALLYALLPRSITWLIMGGGVTRSLGQLFLVLASVNFYLLFTRKQKKYLIPAIISASLVCVTHPEAALHTTGIALIFWLFYGKNRDGIVNSLIAALGTLLLTLPWWLTILLRFGLDPYLSAAQTGLNSAGYFIRLFLPFSGEPFLTMIALLAIIGFAVEIAKSKFLLPVLYVIPFLVEPRNAPNVSIIPMALLASVAFTDLLLPALARMESAIRNIQFERVLQSRAEKFLFVYLIISLMIGMQYFNLDLRKNRVSPQHREAFEWIKLNTPADSKFIILTGKTDLFADYLNEWFPILANRISLTTIQGYEWMGGGLFAERVPVVQEIQLCPNSNPSLTCIESASGDAGFDYNFIYVVKINGGAAWGGNLIYELRNKEAYIPVYEKESVVIFKYNK